MAKYKKSKSYGKKRKASDEQVASGTPIGYYDRNLAAVDPNKEQFEPTEGDPVRQHYKMAGG